MGCYSRDAKYTTICLMGDTPGGAQRKMISAPTENGKKVLIDAAFLPDKETAETVHSLSGWAYKSNSQEQRATV